MEFYYFLTAFLIFFLGASFGSFLNVFFIETEDFFIKGKRSLKNGLNRRSACPHCNHKLSFLDLIPIFSFIFLRGKCNYCKKKISWRYFWVEFFSALLFLAFFLNYINNKDLSFNFIFELFFYIPVLLSIILIFLFDLKYKIIPDLILLPIILYSFFLISFDFSNNVFLFKDFWEIIIKSLIFASPFFLLWLLTLGRGMGFADWKLVFFLSLFLNSYSSNLLFVFMSFWIGALYVLPKIIFKKTNLKSEIPFGPFIIIAFVLVWAFNLDYYSLFLNFYPHQALLIDGNFI